MEKRYFFDDPFRRAAGAAHCVRPTKTSTFAPLLKLAMAGAFTILFGLAPVFAAGVSISDNGVVNAAGYTGGAVSAGEIVAIFGSGLGPSTLVGLQLDSRGYVATSLSDTQVLFDGVAAPLIYTWAGQVSAVVPYEVSGKTSTQVK